MMKRYKGNGLFVGVVLSVSMIAPQLCVAQTAGMSGAAGQVLMASGTITSVDPRQNAFSVKTTLMGEQRFQLTPSATIKDGQRSVKIDDLRPGAEVIVQYKEEGGKRLAEAVTLGKITEPNPVP